MDSLQAKLKAYDESIEDKLELCLATLAALLMFSGSLLYLHATALFA
ncbi:MAG TPA: hypothetical protein VF096_04975 [Azonexus sp.]